jgi:hypothetical protein
MPMGKLMPITVWNADAGVFFIYQSFTIFIDVA